MPPAQPLKGQNESSSGLFIVFDSQCHVVAASDGVGDSLADLCSQVLCQNTDRPQDDSGWQSLFTSASITCRRVKDSESGRWYDITAGPVENENRRRCVCFLRDVTDDRRVEDELERLVAVLENTSDLVSTSTPDGELTFMNAAGRRLLEWAPNETLDGKRIADCHPEWAFDKVNTVGVPFTLKHGVWVGETAIRSRSGKEIPVSQVILAHFDEEGELAYLSTIMRDISESKRSQEALSVSESRFRGLFETIGTGVAIYRPVRDAEEFVFVDINPAGCRLSGLQRDEVLGRRLTEMFPAVRDMGLFEVLQEVARTGRPVHLPMTEYRDDRITQWVDNKVFRLSDGSVVAVYEDQTSERKAQEDLRHAQAQLLAAIECSSAGIIIADAPSGTIRHANAAALAIRNHSADELIGIGMADHSVRWNTRHLDGTAYDPRDLPLSRAILGGETIEGEEVIVRRDNGDDRHVLANAAPIRNEKGAITGGIVIFFDITEQRRLEEEIRENELRFRALADAAREGIFILHGEEILLANEVGAEMFGYDNVEQLIGVSPMSLVAPESMDAVREHIAANSPEAYEAVCVRKDGTHFPVEIRGKPLPYRGEVVRATAVVDLTERKRMKNELMHAEKMRVIGQLAGGIAHDFNNILGGISGTAELIGLLDKQHVLSDRQRQGIEEITGLCQQAADLTNRLLVFSRKRVTKPMPLDVNALVQRTADIVSRVVDKRIQVTFDQEEDIPNILGEVSQVQNAVMNLALNARDAMPEGGWIVFQTMVLELPGQAPEGLKGSLPEGRYSSIVVSDTGSGIPEDVVDHIFEPFFTTKESGKGTGLGLSAVYGTAQSYNGGVAVTSSPETGTRLTLLFPALEGVAADRAHEQEVPVIPGNARILLVDDEEAIRENASQLLKGIGYNVDCASDGETAVQIFERGQAAYDLVILDMIMPSMGGRDTFLQIRSLNPTIPVLIISGYAPQAEADGLINEPRVSFLAKPFRFGALSQAVQDMLKR